MNSTRPAALIAAREVAVELAGREAAATALPFVSVLVVMAGLAFGPDGQVLTATAPGMVWVAVLVAALPLAPGVAAAERYEGSWELLRALAAPGALLVGKVAALWLWLLGCWALASALVAVLLADTSMLPGLAAGLLGTLGVAGTTVVFGVLLPHGSRRPGLLAVLLLPVALPVLVAGTQAATPGVPPGPWLVLLAAYDLITLTVAWATFPVLLEE